MKRRERDKRDWIGLDWVWALVWVQIMRLYRIQISVILYNRFFFSWILWYLCRICVCDCLASQLSLSSSKIYFTPLYTFPNWGIRLQLSLLVLGKHKHTTKVWFMAATNGSIFASSTKPIQTTPSIFCSKASPSSNTLGGFSWSLVMLLIFLGFPLFACNYFMGTCQKLVICDLLEILEPNPLLKLCTTFDC